MTDLTDRYVLTVLRRVPDAQRADLDRELRASIADAVDARVEAGAAPGDAVEATLVELGDPDRLADQYAGRRDHLIGPELFSVWRRLMTLQFSVVLPIVVAVPVVGELADGGPVGEAVGAGIGALLTVGVHLAFWTTLVFAILERTGTGRDGIAGAWKPEHLPRYEQGRAVTSHLVVDLVWIALLIAGLVLQQFTFTEQPLLDPANWSFWWPYLIVVLLLEGAYAIWFRRAGVRTHAMTAVNALLAVASAGPVVWLLAHDRFLNPGYAPFGAEAQGWTSRIVLIVVAVIAVWDVVDQGLRVRRSRRGLGAAVPGSGVRAC